MAEATAQNTEMQGKVTQGKGLKMPELDVAGLNEYLRNQKKGSAQAMQTTMANAPQQQQVQQNTPAASQSPQQGEAPKKPSQAKQGEVFTDENGQKWEWTVMEFEVVPDAVKDEEVDSLSVENEIQEAEGEEDSEGYDSNLDRGLDIALSILREGDADTKGEDVGVAKDEALAEVYTACDEVLGNVPVADAWTSYTHKELDGQRTGIGDVGGYSTERGSTIKQQGDYDVKDFSEMPLSKIARKNYKENADGTLTVGRNLPEAQLSAKRKANQTHRMPVAATWEDCRAKDPYKCRWHGAAYMKNQFGEILKAHGLPIGRFDIDIKDTERGLALGKNTPIPYTISFLTPEGTPEAVKKECLRDFFLKHPGIMVKSPKGASPDKPVSFEVSEPEYLDDMPVDAPTQEDYMSRHDTAKEAEYKERAKIRGAVSYAKFDTFGKGQFFDMLREHPTNSVELNEDMMRYLHVLPECTPEGMTNEEVKDLYDRFKKQNELKNGIRPYILDGEVLDDAEVLADAAREHLAKEDQNYYDTAREVYAVASQIFNNVEDTLWSEYEDVSRELQSLPTDTAMKGGRNGDFKTTVYLGTEWKARGKTFPLQLSGESGEELRSEINAYAELWNLTNQVDDAIMTGCQTRSPMMVINGIRNLKRTIKGLQDCMSKIGELQDLTIKHKSDSWRQKNGIKALPKDKGDESVKEEPPKKGAMGSEPKKPPQKVDEETSQAQKKTEQKEPTDQQADGQGSTSVQKEQPQETRSVSAQEQRTIPKKQPKQSATIEAKGKGIDIIPETPTLEDAKAMNKQFAELEKHLQEVTEIFKTVDSKSDEWKSAEAEMKAIKSGLDDLMKKARGKGYQWTKDAAKFGMEGPSDKRPLDLPTNFHIAGIKDGTGKTVSVPYTAPKMERNPAQTGKSSKPQKKDAQRTKKSVMKQDTYPEQFDSIVEKIGDIGVGVYAGKTLSDLIDEGYVVRPQRVKGSNQTEWFLGKPSQSNSAGIEVSKENPPLWLRNVFQKRMGGDPNDETALQDFIDVLSWKVEDRDYAKNLFEGI